MSIQETITEPEFKIYVVLTSIFVGVIVIGIALGSKLVNVFGLTATFSIFTYPVTFAVTDTIAEIWGKSKAKQTVLCGFIVIVICFAFIQIAIRWPGASIWKDQESYNKLFGISARLIIGGVLGYLASQYHDVWAFHFWKRLTKGKHLWLRNNFSTAVSQFIDTVIFVTISFWGVVPLFQLIIGQYVMKLSLAVLDTPFIYLFVWLIRKRINSARASS